MAIQFTSDDWARMKEDYGKWWDHTLERPLLKVTLQHDGQYTGGVPRLTQATCHRLDIPAEDVVERLNWELEQQEYLGDAFPYVNFDVFGPGIVAAFLGAELDNSTGNVWFHGKPVEDIADIHVEFDPNNVWFHRIKDIYHAGNQKWHGNVLMSMPDLGGIMDIMSTLRGSQDLLCDLYDAPDEVKRLSKEIREVWMQIYRGFEEVLMQEAHGYSDWSGLFSNTPSYVLQSDFSFMIGPKLFGEFVVEELTWMCRQLSHSLYHMDGVGELPLLPQLLQIEELDAIQWCPGEGVPRIMEWPDVFKQIRASGKNMHILGNETDFRFLAREIGAKGLYQNLWTRPASQRQEMLQFLEEFGVPARA